MLRRVLVRSQLFLISKLFGFRVNFLFIYFLILYRRINVCGSSRDGVCIWFSERDGFSHDIK